MSKIILIFYSSRELKCSCKGFDDSTIGGQGRLSDIIQERLDSPPNNPKVSHIVLRQCKKLDLLLDTANLDPAQYDITDLSFESTPYLKLEFNQPRQSSLKLVVQNSIETTLKGTLDENQNDIQMFFRNVGGSSDNYRRSEVIFDNFFSRSSIDLLNFINIGNIIVDTSSIQNIDNFEIRDREIIRDPTNCFKIADDNVSRVRVNCTRQELFYNNIRSEKTRRSILGSVFPMK